MSKEVKQKQFKDIAALFWQIKQILNTLSPPCELKFIHCKRQKPNRLWASVTNKNRGK